MKSRPTITLLAALAVAAARTAAADAHPRFEPLRPLLGKTWRSESVEAGRKTVDVSRFELALNGQAVRNLHSINDGEYGGETLIVWEEARQSLVFYYFTTAGFYTTGTFRGEDGALVSHEAVKGAAGGITEVKGTSRVLPDGRLHVKTEYLKEGKWVPGRDAYYTEDASAVVRFKD